MSDDTKIDEVVKKISLGILSGDYVNGQRLPAERDLAEQFQVSRQTVRYALRRLQAESMLEIVPSSGAYVHARRAKGRIGPTVTALNKGEQTTFKEISVQAPVPDRTSPADAWLAEKMQIEEHTPLLRRTRLYLEDQVPYRLVERYSSPAFLERFAGSSPNPSDWLKNALEQSPTPARAVEGITCRLPNEKEAEALNINRNQPVFELERWILGEQDQVLQYVHTIANAALQELTYIYGKENWDDLLLREHLGI